MKKKQKPIIPFIVIALISLILFLNRPQEKSKPEAEALEKSEPAAHYLTKGELKKGIRLKKAELKKDANDSHLRFELGLMLVYSAFEDMYQQAHAWGMRGNINQFLGEWTQLNRPKEPHSVTYEEFCKLFDDFYEKLDEAQGILSKARDLKEPVELPIGKIKLDLNGNGTLEQSESLDMIFETIMGDEIGEKLDTMVVKFDQGDITWLEGYCHVAMCLQDMAFNFELDWAYQYVGKLIFDEISYDGIDFKRDRMLLEQRKGDRLKKAHAHLRKAIALSHESWAAYRAESDDDHEWVPNPSQTSLFQSIQVTDEVIESWLSMITEMDAVLTGEKLVPTFSYYDTNMGFNVKRFFLETKDVDLNDYEKSLPYGEYGELTDIDFWRSMWRMFPGSNGMFALWVN